MAGFASLANQFSSGVPFLVWLNPYHGVIEHEGKRFTDMKVYKENKNRIAGIIQIPEARAQTFGIDIENMLKARQTFKKAQESNNVTLMAKQRLKIFERKIFASISAGVISL